MEKYTLNNYGKQSTFAGFLPGISGIRGIPIWCFYVNRGQGVVSFGIQDKDHAIMEFYPAHQAYQNVKRTGFRTFLKKNEKFLEPFSKEEKEQTMHILMNGLELEERDAENQLFTKVSYCTLPEEPVGALIRKVTVRNEGQEEIRLEILDGMPAVIPYGVNEDSMKTMGQTSKAWMMVEDVEKGVPYFKVRASMADTAAVTEIKGGNFSCAFLKEGNALAPIVDPNLVFGYDLSLEKPVGFLEKGVTGLWEAKQVTQNQLPCSFYAASATLKAGEEITLYQLTGQVENKEILENFLKKVTGGFLEEKMATARRLVAELTEKVTTKTASKEFDAYCRYTYLDNVLRGGCPIQLTDHKVFYVYSRKHGDLERDYNYFSMLPEYYSQGNGNFRDVNQNRRCDVFFAPFVGKENIRTFYSFIQMDGYNPLSVDKVTYSAEGEESPFTPGQLFKRLAKEYDEEETMKRFTQIMEKAESTVNASFLEGYWSDHWTYNLDLIENYLQIFPEKEEELLFTKEYSYFLPQIKVNPRKKRYAKTEKGIRQYHALDEGSKLDGTEKLVRGNFGKGEILTSTLLEKLILLSTIKFATLDAYGMGVEMEGGKPGWYDALNGMPGLFGSSMAETYELGRNMEYVIKVLKKYSGEVELLKELAELIQDINEIVSDEWSSLVNEKQVLSFWNRVNDVKEAYRAQIYEGVSGERTKVSLSELAVVLQNWYTVVRTGIEKACAMEDGICPTYFTFRVTEYEESEEGIAPKGFEPVKVPLFLEGPVRYLKLNQTRQEKHRLYEKIKESDLYDRTLSMYKVNASLAEASYELGRAKSFTPGWLENESIWLHMEYKYLLELLKSGMYEEFFEDFHKAAIPFLDPKVYGRSILENSSFIASSKNPDKSIHGKGFVARLSGSTVELLDMWKRMFFGATPFTVQKGELVFALQPAIPDYLIDESKTVEALFLGKVKVVYHMEEQKDYIPGEYAIKEMTLKYMDGGILTTNDNRIVGQVAEDIRSGKIKEINVSLA